MIPSAIAWLNNVFLRVFFRTVQLSSTEDEDKSHMCLINCLYWPFFFKKGNALIVTKKNREIPPTFFYWNFFFENASLLLFDQTSHSCSTPQSPLIKTSPRCAFAEVKHSRI